MDDDQYRELQEFLIEKPEIGDIIQGSGGVLYYWTVSADQIRMLYVYSKGDQKDLTKDQLKELRQVVERW